MQKLPGDAVLLIIDAQKGFDNPVWGSRNNPEAESNIAVLLKTWRQTKRPVFHVQHLSRSAGSPLSPGQSGSEFKDMVRPIEDESIFQKRVNSAFIGTDLEARLREKNLNTHGGQFRLYGLSGCRRYGCIRAHRVRWKSLSG